MTSFWATGVPVAEGDDGLPLPEGGVEPGAAGQRGDRRHGRERCGRTTEARGPSLRRTTNYAG